MTDEPTCSGNTPGLMIIKFIKDSNLIMLWICPSLDYFSTCTLTFLDKSNFLPFYVWGLMTGFVQMGHNCAMNSLCPSE